MSGGGSFEVGESWGGCEGTPFPLITQGPSSTNLFKIKANPALLRQSGQHATLSSRLGCKEPIILNIRLQHSISDLWMASYGNADLAIFSNFQMSVCSFLRYPHSTMACTGRMCIDVFRSSQK